MCGCRFRSRRRCRCFCFINDCGFSSNGIVVVSSAINKQIRVSHVQINARNTREVDAREAKPEVRPVESSKNSETKEHAENDSEKAQESEKNPARSSTAFAGLSSFFSGGSFLSGLLALVGVELLVDWPIKLFNDFMVSDFVVNILNFMNLGSCNRLDIRPPM